MGGSALADALRRLGSDAFGPEEHLAVKNALSIVAEGPDSDVPLPQLVADFLAWLLEHPRQLDTLRAAPAHSHLSLLGEVYRRFTIDQDPSTPLGRMRGALQIMFAEATADADGWFIRTPDHRIRLRDHVVGAWPITLLLPDASGLRPEALAHATAALMGEGKGSMTAGEIARGLLDHYPTTFDGRSGPVAVAEGPPTLDPMPPALAPDNPELWDKQHAAQLLCRFTHEELILVASRLRDDPEIDTAAKLRWPVALVRQRSQKAWARLEEYLGHLEQTTRQSARSLVRLVEEVLLDMDI